jgi:NitT/TauT family transport system ATP-binding protein
MVAVSTPEQILSIQDRNTGKNKFLVQNLSHSFNAAKDKTVEVLRNINISVEEHEFLAIVGPSGCGKSTLLNIMSGLLKPTQGQILLDGELLKDITTRIGYISQTDSLLPWRTAIANVELGLELRDVPKKERKNIALKLIKQADLNGFEKSYPYELSGGMKKRVDIIRILAVEPEVIFMDEPFGALDVFTREMLQDYILSLWQKTRKTIIFVTHDLGEAITLADRVIIMTARPATIKSEYPIPLPRPRSPLDIRFDPKFIKIHKRIWYDLKEEVQKSGE